ncbi:MAG TPA: preprotein translocase subunit SecG [Xanthomonadaceae bacterium]|nr:preprotein translocase subunit SecG [Xanthomonadaceae bacterium]
MLTLVNVLYVLLSIAMVALILLQRGSGAAAGSGFGAGASGTVFGARGAANFLSKSTAVLATLFFALSLGMAWYASRSAPAAPQDDLGVMSSLAEPAPQPAPETATPSEVPSAPQAEQPESEQGDANPPQGDGAVPEPAGDG